MAKVAFAKEIKELTRDKLDPTTLLSLQTFALRDSTGPLAAAELLNNAGAISCVLGAAGTGKTSLLHVTLAEWAASEDWRKKLCLYFDLERDCKGRSEGDMLLKAFKEAFLYSSMANDFLQRLTDAILRTDGEGVTLLLDDFKNTKMISSIFHRIVSRELLPKATVIIAGRFNMLDTVVELTGNNPCSFYSLEGLKPGCETALLESLRVRLKSDRAAEYIQHHCPELCTNPGVVGKLLTTFRDRPPTTFTEMLEAAVMGTINDSQNKLVSSSWAPPGEFLSLTTIQHELLDKLNLVSKLAYLSVESDTDHYTFSDLSKHMTLNGGENYNFSEDLDIGLLTEVRSIDAQGIHITYQFLHKAVREFLAAYYMSTLPLLDQISLFCRSSNSMLFGEKYANFTKFYFGMAHILSKCQSKKQVLTFGSTWALKPLLETVIGSKLFVDEEPEIKTQKSTFIFQLLQECQDTNLVKKFLHRREKYIKIIAKSSKISEPLIKNLAFVISNSGISKWSIGASDSTVHSAEYVAMLVHTESLETVNVNVYTDTTSRHVFEVLPHMQGGGGGVKKLSPSTAHVRCMREVLHRILQLYSPIKLKSNSAEPSYISFLACQCLRDKVEREQMLTIEPIRAVHWVSVKLKAKPKHVASADRTTGNETELYRHMTRHNNEQLEMVVMMSPLPHRVCYRDPTLGGGGGRGGERVETIELSSSSLVPHFLDGRIARSLQDHLLGGGATTEDAARGIIAFETQFRTSQSECVTLPLIIPPSVKEFLGQVVLDAGGSSNPSASATEKSKSEEDALSDRSRKRKDKDATPDSQDGLRAGALAHHCLQQPMVVEADGAVAVPCGSGSSMASFGSQQSSQAASLQQQQPPPQKDALLQPSVQQSLSEHQQRQVAVPPGTVLHITSPSPFVVDKVYPLPEESHLLRKGGNGAIFAVSYFGRDYAVKKTAYRNREFTIHKKLRHPNIVELSCFMFGPLQPQQTRRYFCYHFMPRASGDLARMVTDRPEMTMHALSREYQEEPRRMGSLQGNWKYLLRELLKGLAYMHSLSIVHRDLKASNVLVRMLCSCENPLVCTCAQKCSVKIADFDSALELDSNGSLPPTTTKLLTQMQGAVYQIVPVGTDGYRSPEASQLIVSNDLSVLSPALTVKTDIWSVGLILLRMLNGCNGPTRQQKLSTLLLYYQQERKMLEPNVRPRLPKFLRVRKRDVERIIGLHRFAEVSNPWISKAVECIARCVEVDPEKRPKAQELLRHPFLF